jgi:serine/threonine protein phosphatase 1
MLPASLKAKVLRFATTAPEVPAGTRVYAIGDVHGRLDLLSHLISLIEQDEAQRAPCDTQIILLGDLVDRGPESCGVIDLALALAQRRAVRVLFGNHEEMFLNAIQSDSDDAMRHFVRNGGRETLLSYGLTEEAYRDASFGDLRQWARANVPDAHLGFLSSLEQLVVAGDYAFVHAGIRPGVALHDQTPSDLRWIRGEFLRSKVAHEKLIIHGHTVVDRPDEQKNRICIDTGAYKSGVLTALGFEGTRRWYLTAAEAELATSRRHARIA